MSAVGGEKPSGDWQMIESPKGTYNVLPAEAARREVLEHHARKLLGGAGYQRIETPMFEATELFSRGVGASSDIVQKDCTPSAMPADAA